MSNCEDCLFAIWDYEEYYGTKRKNWFVDGCSKGIDGEAEECEEFEEL